MGPEDSGRIPCSLVFFFFLLLTSLSTLSFPVTSSEILPEIIVDGEKRSRLK